MLTRQRNGSAVAGTRIISWVIPPPFFHGTGTSDDLRMICIAADHTVFAAAVRAASTLQRLLDNLVVVRVIVFRVIVVRVMVVRVIVVSGVPFILVVALEFFRSFCCFVGLAHGNLVFIGTLIVP